MSTSLQTNVINEFGGSGSIPTNMRAYLKLGAVLNWNGGVAEHDNNSAIPTSGSLSLSNFASPASRDFVSNTYTIGQAFSSTFDPLIGQIDYVAAGVNDGVNNQTAIYTFTLVSPNTFGTFGSRKTIGKSTYGSAGQVATLTGVWDIATYLNGSYVDGNIYVQMVGDQRRSGWGGTGTAGGTSGAAPTTVTITAAGQSPLTLNFSGADTPLGSYNGTYNVTTWSWSSIALANLKILAAANAGQTTFFTRVSIF
jgi:hypothetical protein